MPTLLRLLAAAAAAAALAPPAAAGYTVTPLGTLGGSSSFALAVNDAGQVTGNAQTPPGTPAPRLNAFLWEDGVMTNLGTLPGSNNFSRGYAINNRGVVVGESDNSASRAFRYDPAGGLTDLGGLPPNNRGVAHGVNDPGVVVGASFNGSAVRAVRFNGDGTATDLGSIDGLTTTPARAWDVNNAGRAVGHSRDAAGVGRATLWQPDGTVVDLGGLSADGFAEAFAVSETGLVAGAAVAGTTPLGTPIRRPFLYDGTSLSELGRLGRMFGEAKDVNDAGEVVGFVTNVSGLPDRAVLWRGGAAFDLNDLIPAGSGWVLRSAEGINNRGQIVGYGTFDGRTQAFLLTPVPAPPGVVLAAVGAAGLAAPGVRRRLWR
jgi:probable HAF family extracellular repeat protein